MRQIIQIQKQYHYFFGSDQMRGKKQFQHYHKIQMAFLGESLLDGLGIGFSIAGLALVLPLCFLFRTYLRFLDHLQLFMAFSLGLGTTSTIFSNKIKYSWAAFNKNFLNPVCQDGDFVCTAGFQLSFGSCLLVFLLIMRIIVFFQARRRKDVRFEPVYTFFKGLSRWIYAALSFYSIFYLIRTLQKNQDSLKSSIGVLVICVFFPVLQLVGYKCIQTQKDYIWRKWLQFMNFYRLLLITGLVALAMTQNKKLPYYFIYGVEVIYAFFFAWKNKFIYPALGRTFFIIGQALFIAVFSFFLFKIKWLENYNLDFIGVAVVLLLDIIYYIIEMVYISKNGAPDDNLEKVNPEASEDQNARKKRSNAYAVDLNDIDDNEFNNSNENILSPSKGSGNLSKSKVAAGRARRR